MGGGLRSLIEYGYDCGDDVRDFDNLKNHELLKMGFHKTDYANEMSNISCGSGQIITFKVVPINLNIPDDLLDTFEVTLRKKTKVILKKLLYYMEKKIKKKIKFNEKNFNEENIIPFNSNNIHLIESVILPRNNKSFRRDQIKKILKIIDQKYLKFELSFHLNFEPRRAKWSKYYYYCPQFKLKYVSSKINLPLLLNDRKNKYALMQRLSFEKGYSLPTELWLHIWEFVNLDLKELDLE